MLRPHRESELEEPLAIESHALENLKFIRRTMEGAGAFTMASGFGQAWIGLSALGAAWLAARQPTPQGWLTVWLGEAALAFAIAMGTMAWKARRAGIGLGHQPALRFARSFSLPMIAGAALTTVFARDDGFRWMPGAWLLLFGTGVASGGAFSVPAVRNMGYSFMGLGVIALFAPAAWHNALLAIGFGGLLAAFGLYIARRHGG